ncbi:hypothetical protein FB45DRAFT_1025645 [Roridomyces roridus]|uniref:MYND-type domain-containing protein n=1 Tax=Roridomyces roridus TaxID=1738132 RepID=A0AAD7FNN0_9AGAR|nr:hypothetical protein FB45DRAFT_1025645 [Roridomyces roridus]
MPPDPLSAELGTNRYTCVACYKPEPKGQKFLKCGACRKTAYCSKECQREDWKNHKKVCQAQGENRENLPERGTVQRDTISSIKKWFSKHTQLLLYCATHAFQLHDPANAAQLKTHMLVVQLDQAPEAGRGDFVFNSVALRPMTDFNDPATCTALAQRADTVARDRRYSLTMFVRSGQAVYLAPITIPQCSHALEHLARWGPPDDGWAEFMQRAINNARAPEDVLRMSLLRNMS